MSKEKRSPTPEQSAAIDIEKTHGKVIVSASAGSGKTFVMVQRLLSLLRAGVRIEELLAVTFTNKAAAQMRDRIRSTLLDEIAEGSDFLREALSSLPAADICTIHSLCGRLIRTYFYLVGVDPAFRIVGGEDAECRALSARAMDRVFEEAYETGELEELLAVYFRKKKDTRLKDNVLKLYEKARLAPDYRGWTISTKRCNISSISSPPSRRAILWRFRRSRGTSHSTPTRRDRRITRPYSRR